MNRPLGITLLVFVIALTFIGSASILYNQDQKRKAHHFAMTQECPAAEREMAARIAGVKKPEKSLRKILADTRRFLDSVERGQYKRSFEHESVAVLHLELMVCHDRGYELKLFTISDGRLIPR